MSRLNLYAQKAQQALGGVPMPTTQQFRTPTTGMFNAGSQLTPQQQALAAKAQGFGGMVDPKAWAQQQAALRNRVAQMQQMRRNDNATVQGMFSGFGPTNPASMYAAIGRPVDQAGANYWSQQQQQNNWTPQQLQQAFLNSARTVTGNQNLNFADRFNPTQYQRNAYYRANAGNPTSSYYGMLSR